MRDAGLELELAITQDRCLNPIAEVLGRVERRRRFSVEQKVAVLAEATAPGANMSEVARRHLSPDRTMQHGRLALTRTYALASL